MLFRSRIEGVCDVIFYTYWVPLITNMPGMHKSSGGPGCDSLLENTAVILSEETLQILIVSAQETNIALCIKYATKKCVVMKVTYCEVKTN